MPPSPNREGGKVPKQRTEAKRLVRPGRNGSHAGVTQAYHGAKRASADRRRAGLHTGMRQSRSGKRRDEPKHCLSQALKSANRFFAFLAPGCTSCIIRSGVEATSSEFWPKRKIPPPSSLDGRVGGRSPSAALNTSGSYKLDGKSAGAVGLPSPRNPAEKLIVKQRALVVQLILQDRAFPGFLGPSMRGNSTCLAKRQMKTNSALERNPSRYLSVRAWNSEAVI